MKLFCNTFFHKFENENPNVKAYRGGEKKLECDWNGWSYSDFGYLPEIGKCRFRGFDSEKNVVVFEPDVVSPSPSVIFYSGKYCCSPEYWNSNIEKPNYN